GDVDVLKSLSADQKAAIKSSWAAFAADITGNGSNVLVQFFKDYPGDQSYFKKFDGKKPDELKGDAQLATHASQVFGSLNNMIDSMDDPDKMVGLLCKNASDHIPRGVRQQQYKELFSTLMNYMQSLPGANVAGDTKAAWDKALNAMANIIDAEQKRL
uniref:Globin n=1 Tax=Nerita albicilla TaxID=52928 RepID=GLB_NERAL|nr:RecName: Full=Globin; AltName: Full=Myoglobin [Nerita albicilla]